MPGILYIIATPIGNLQDITLRAIETLKGVDLILCEDTRVTKRLLERFGVDKPALSYHQHSAMTKTGQIVNLLEEGRNLALVSDAGTPGISDPGNKLIEELTDRFGDKIRIIPVPGPSALAAALSVCGFPSDKFVFLGFPPAKNKRKKFFENMATQPYPAVIYESTHRIIKTMKEIGKAAGDASRRIVVCRELTKQFETIYRGTVDEVIVQLEQGVTKGEFVVVLEGENNCR